MRSYTGEDPVPVARWTPAQWKLARRVLSANLREVGGYPEYHEDRGRVTVQWRVPMTTQEELGLPLTPEGLAARHV